MKHVEEVQVGMGRSKHLGYWVVAGIFLMSTGIGVYAYARFNQSEKHLTETLLEFQRIGESLSTQACADHVMNWFPQCSAMMSLCQDSVQRMMMACLYGERPQDSFIRSDRKQMCQEIEPVRRTTSFGYQECSSRGLERTGRKACADVYRGIDKFCEEISKG